MMKQEILSKSYRFAFVLPVRFPTEKAYGVTTENTAWAVAQANFDVFIVTPRFDERFKTKLPHQLIGKTLHRILLSFDIPKVSEFLFHIFVFLFSFLVRIKIRDKNTIFWTRNILLTFILSLFGNRLVICEIHHPLTYLKKLVLRILIRRENVVIAPIVKYLCDDLGESPRVIEMPMCVNETDLCGLETLDLRTKSIVYLGHLSSSGVNLDLNWLYRLGEWLFNHFPDWTLTVIGVTEEDFLSNVGRALPRNLNVVGYLPREQVFRFLREAAYGIVMYSESSFYRNTFPIKIVEYAASGCALVVSDTTAHKRILDESLCYYFKLDDDDSIRDLLSSLLGQGAVANKRAKVSRLWVGDYTYPKRIAPVLEIVRERAG